MSIAYTGGSDVYSRFDTPTVEMEVLRILEEFIKENFRKGIEVSKEVKQNSDKRIIFFAESTEEESPATFGNRKDELIAYGTFSYRAREHSVQTIWENRFEIRSDGEDVYVRVSDWYGTTVESWNKKVKQNKIV